MIPPESDSDPGHLPESWLSPRSLLQPVTPPEPQPLASRERQRFTVREPECLPATRQVRLEVCLPNTTAEMRVHWFCSTLAFLCLLLGLAALPNILLTALLWVFAGVLGRRRLCGNCGTGLRSTWVVQCPRCHARLRHRHRSFRLS